MPGTGSGFLCCSALTRPDEASDPDALAVGGACVFAFI